MLRSRMDRVKAGRARLLVVALLAVGALGGCYWRQYPRLMETHLGLMIEFAEKLESLAEAGRVVPPERWGEFTYPLERARDFARIAAKRYPDRASLASFDRAVSVYGALVADPRILDGPDAESDVARQVAELRLAAEEVRVELARER